MIPPGFKVSSAEQLAEIAIRTVEVARRMGHEPRVAFLSYSNFGNPEGSFLDRIRDGKRPRANIEEGHKSTRLCHLGNIAYRLRRTLKFDATAETIPGDAEASRLLGRSYRKPFVLPERV